MARGLAGIAPEAADLLIERQRRFFAARGEPVEWKTWSHDQPEDFGERLEWAGFRGQEEETVMVGLAADIGPAPALPPGVVIREISAGGDFERLAVMMGTVWGDDHSWLANEYRSDHESRPDAVLVFVAEVGGKVVSGARVDLEEGTEFCTLWGGATLPEWRHQGIYRALVAIRAQLALERGYRYLEVDASPASRPVLEGLGLMPVTTSTPYFWEPPPTNGKLSPG
jgi:GNAT superfamily N-acetyltransferase